MSGLLVVRADEGSAAAHARDLALGRLGHRGTPRVVDAHGWWASTLSRGEHDETSTYQDDDLTVLTAGPVDEVAGRLHPGSDAARLVAEQVRTVGAALAARAMRGAHTVVAVDATGITAWRDQVGFGPLFHASSDGGRRVALCSEPLPALLSLGVRPTPALDGISSVFWEYAEEDAPTPWAGAHRIPKATLVTADHRGLRLSGRYWSPEPLLEGRPLDGLRLQEEFDERFERAVDRVLRGRDVIALSGGVDSPAVSAYASPRERARFDSPLRALSTVYPGRPSVDESAWVGLVAERHGLELTTYEPRLSNVVRLTEVARRLAGPVPASMTTDVEEFYARARELSDGVVLTGEFAEYVMEMRADLVPYLLRHGRLGGAVRFLAARRRGGQKRRNLVLEALPAVTPYRLRAWRRARRRPPLPDFLTAAHDSQVTLEPPGREWRVAQTRAFFGAGLTVEADEILQQWCDVVVRRPWIDVDLWELFLGLPAEQKFPESRYKGLVKRLLRGRVPDEILDRRSFTTFDETLLAGLDRESLLARLREPVWRLPGVDYERLEERLRSQDPMDVTASLWATGVAGVHAFLEVADDLSAGESPTRAGAD